MAFMAKQRAKFNYNTGIGILNKLSTQKDLQKAISVLQLATKLDPSFDDAFYYLAHAWYLVADGFISTTFRQDFWLKVYQERGILKENADTEEFIISALESALTTVDQAIAIRHNFPIAHNLKAMTLARLLRLDEAMKEIEAALSQSPDYYLARKNKEKFQKMIEKQSTIPAGQIESGYLQKIKILEGQV